MLNICLLSIITVLCVAGIYFIIKEIMNFLLRRHVGSRVTLEIYNDADSAEYILRNALRANPTSEIDIVDKSGNKEIGEIIRKLATDNRRIHIVNI